MIICFDVRSEKYDFVKFLDKNFYKELLDCNSNFALVVRGKSLYVKVKVLRCVLYKTLKHINGPNVFTYCPLCGNM